MTPSGISDLKSSNNWESKNSLLRHVLTTNINVKIHSNISSYKNPAEYRNYDGCVCSGSILSKKEVHFYIQIN